MEPGWKCNLGGVKGPGFKGSGAGVGVPGLVELRGGDVGPRSVRSVADGENTGPEHAKPYKKTVGPGHVMLLAGVVEPRCRKSETKRAGPSCARLLSDATGPSCVESGADEHEPGRPAPETENNASGQPKCFDSKGGPVLKKSGAAVNASRHAELRGNSEDAKVVQSVAGGEDTGPDRAKPYNGTVDP